MPPASVLLIAALAAGLYYSGKPIMHVAKKTGHAIVHVVTLGKK